MIVGGDFNCVLSQADCTDNMNYSKALDKLVHGLKLTDVWTPTQPRAIYTLYSTRSGKTRPPVRLAGPTKP